MEALPADMQVADWPAAPVHLWPPALVREVAFSSALRCAEPCTSEDAADALQCTLMQLKQAIASAWQLHGVRRKERFAEVACERILSHHDSRIVPSNRASLAEAREDAGRIASQSSTGTPSGSASFSHAEGEAQLPRDCSGLVLAGVNHAPHPPASHTGADGPTLHVSLAHCAEWLGVQQEALLSLMQGSLPVWPLWQALLNECVPAQATLPLHRTRATALATGRMACM